MRLFGERRTFMSGLSVTDRSALSELGTSHEFRPDQRLMREGERTTFRAILLRGWCTVWAATERGTIILALRQSGEIVGDMAALDGRPRSASVSALGPVSGLVVPSDRFRVFLASRPHANALLISQFSEPRQSAGRRAGPPPHGVGPGSGRTMTPQGWAPNGAAQHAGFVLPAHVPEPFVNEFSPQGAYQHRARRWPR
jgi:hypothetical protein